MVAGDEVALARRLRVPTESVVDWIFGQRPVPTKHFLKLVDIVLDDTRHQNTENRAVLDEMRKRHRR